MPLRFAPNHSLSVGADGARISAAECTETIIRGVWLVTQLYGVTVGIVSSAEAASIWKSIIKSRAEAEGMVLAVIITKPTWKPSAAHAMLKSLTNSGTKESPGDETGAVGIRLFGIGI